MKKVKTTIAPLNWLKRMFMGASATLPEDFGQHDPANDVEELVSPGKQYFRSFMERKLAVVAACVVIAMFVLVFVGPLFMPGYDDAYTEVTQKNVPPGFRMMKVPAALKNDVKMVDAYGAFSVGLSNAGDVYVWGETNIGTTNINVADIPAEVEAANIVWVAAGFDHIIAIGDDGIVYAWGNNRLGQYGYFDPAEYPNIAPMPDELLNGKIDVANIKKVEAGYQATAILMNDGSFYLWGNKHAYGNIDNILMYDNKLLDIGLTLNYVAVVPESAKTVFTGAKGLYTKYKTDVQGETDALASLLKGRSISELACAGSNVCLLLDDGSILLSGDFARGSESVPELDDGEYFTDVQSGSYHYTGITNEGNVYAWGGNVLGQCRVPGSADGADTVFSCAFQNYAVDESGKLISKWGLSGYLFGTDGYGADIFQRLINGGAMTMTIGAVAVIISTIIGIIIGCISGYFGGKVDIILMRVTEIFAAIPFIPFAMILSSIMGHYPVGEKTRIFIIMCILGVLTWSGLARLVRGQVLVARENEYVTAAKAMGVKENKIAFKHILPNIISVILVTLTLDFAGCMLTESSLSYLGFGVTYPTPTWGNMLNGANNATIIKNFWWQWLFPAIFLAITTICINIVGDTLRDVMDPKSSADR